ncbi:hypothetical protein JW933_01960 [candidate division FCPU426 bacterium]|nr:hypothetical protein [candidate division FCPU426 bacterium]
MKSLTPALIAIVLLATAVWAGYYLLFPDYPLTAKETLLIVFLSAMAVYLCKWIYGKLKHRSTR